MSDHQINPTGPKSAPQKKASSLAKIDANRKSSKESTGPKTPAGKTAVSKNALRSGIYAQKWLAVTGDEQHMANHVLGELRQQYPAADLLDELMHETFVQKYLQRWRFIQAYGGMMDARRGQIALGIPCDLGASEDLSEIQKLHRWLTTTIEQLKRTGQVTPEMLKNLERVAAASEPAAALVAELKRIAPNEAQPEEAKDTTQAQQLAEDLAKALEATTAEWEARIAKQEDAACRQAALPSDAEAKKFLRYDRDTSRGLQRAADAIARRWGRAPILQRQERKAA